MAVRELMFSEEEVKDISGFKIISEGDYVEVTCGCTSHQYGDAVGTLRVYLNGNLEIKCDCTPGCDEGYKYFFYTIIIFLCYIE